MEKEAKIYVAGHRGMVGSALVRKLTEEGYANLLLRTSSELDLCDQLSVKDFFERERPHYVFLAAAKVGGILANNMYRADFLYQNLMIASNVIHQSYAHDVKKLLFLGSSCIYPKQAPQPIKEEYLLSGYLEETNEPYAIAKIAGLKLCENYRRQHGCNFITAMPCNLYGPNDNYDLQQSHVIPALLRKFHEAKVNNKPIVEVWGSGKPLREFLHVDDLATACYFLMKNYSDQHAINIGTGKDISIDALAHLIKGTIGYKGDVAFDTSKPDGAIKKMMNVDKINSMGWQAHIPLHQGLKMVYDFCQKTGKFLACKN